MAWLRFGLTAASATVLAAIGGLVLIGFALIRAVWWPSRQMRVASFERPPLDEAGAVERLAGALRIATITRSDPDQLDHQAFDSLNQHLAASFPRTFDRLGCQVVSRHSRLLTWTGTVPRLAPILLIAHLDVVPAGSETVTKWTHEPFSGDVADGFIWGRGALDMKSSLVGMLEATESLLEQGYQPERSVYFAFGHDEEVGGSQGATVIAEELRGRGIRFAMVLDEGGAIVEGLVPGVAPPIALVGIAEKGFANIELSASSEPGHSSMPPPRTAVGLIAAAVTALEGHPMPASLEGPTGLMFDRLGPEMRGAMRIFFANQWLFRGLILKRLAARPSSNATVRTTMAATVIRGGAIPNVLPAEARAIVNVRIKPEDSLDEVLAHLRRVVDDNRVRIRVLEDGHPPAASEVARVTTDGYRAIERAVRTVWPQAVVAPSLTVTACDSRHYADLADDVYRLLPYTFHGTDDTGRIHGIDERISVSEYLRCVQFYMRFLELMTSGTGGASGGNAC